MKTSRNVVLGGAKAKVSRHGSIMRNTASSDLICLNCDLPVNRWVGKVWNSNSDYIFFRNNAPDREKMAIMLESKSTYAAYACQCSWISTDQVLSINIGQYIHGKKLSWTTK